MIVYHMAFRALILSHLAIYPQKHFEDLARSELTVMSNLATCSYTRGNAIASRSYGFIFMPRNLEYAKVQPINAQHLVISVLSSNGSPSQEKDKEQNKDFLLKDALQVGKVRFCSLEKKSIVSNDDKHSLETNLLSLFPEKSSSSKQSSLINVSSL